MSSLTQGKCHDGCKILVISRDKGVCENMGASLCIEIKPLFFKYALNLFKRTSYMDNLGRSPFNLPLIAYEVIKACEGVPLAIINVANFLKDKKDLNVWEDALRQLKESSPKSLNGLHRSVYSSLLLIYQGLPSNDHKIFFLICCLFPTDRDSSIESLPIYGRGFTLLFDGIWEQKAVTNIAFQLAQDLRHHKLLRFDKSLGRSIRIHGCVRDFGLLIASYDKHWCFHSEESVTSQTDKFLFGVFVAGLPESIDCPRKEIFVWRSMGQTSLPSSFLDMERHLALRFLDISGNYLQSLSFISDLENLDALSIRNCQVDDFSHMEESDGLEVLNFAGSKIGWLPSDMKHLAQLKILQLTNCCAPKMTSVCLFESFPQLKCLYIDGFTTNDGREAALNLAELRDMLPNLHTLVFRKLQLCKVIFENLKGQDQFKKLMVLEIVKCDGVECLFDTIDIDFLPALEELKISEMDELRELYRENQHVPFGFFRKVKCMRISYCKSLKHVFGINLARNLQNLQKLEVTVCSTMEEIVRKDDLESANNGNEDVSLLPMLEELELISLRSLRSFYATFPSTSLFNGRIGLPSLKRMKIRYAYGITHIWQRCANQNIDSIGEHKPKLIPTSFGRLESVEIEACTRLRVVNMGEELESLKSLKIVGCGMLEEICQVSDIVDNEGPHASPIVLPLIESITLYGLPKLNQLWWNRVPNGHLCLRNLKTFCIDGCDRLEYVFCHCAAKGLIQLEQLSISGCNLMRVVIQTEPGGEEIVFPKLESYTLSNLPQLIEGLRPVKCTINCRGKIINCHRFQRARETNAKKGSGVVIQSIFNEQDSSVTHKVMY